MSSGIFSAVRIWSERAVTTLLHLTLADSLTGCQIGVRAKMKSIISIFSEPPCTWGPFCDPLQREFQDKWDNLCHWPAADWNGGQRLPQQHFFRLKNVAGGFTFAAEPHDTKFFSFRWFHGWVLSIVWSYSHATASLNKCRPFNAPSLILQDWPEAIQSSVQTFLSGFGNGLLKYCAIVQFWGGQRNIFRVILIT